MKLSLPLLRHVPLLGILSLAAAGCGDASPPPAQVVEITSRSGSTVQGQATASSRRGVVKLSVAFHGLGGPASLRLAAHPGSCPADTGGAPADALPGEGPPRDPAAGALARQHVTTEGTSGAGTLEFAASELPEGGDVAIFVRDFTGVVLACGEVVGLPVTELPEGAEPPPAPGQTAPPPAPADPAEEAPATEGGVSA